MDGLEFSGTQLMSPGQWFWNELEVEACHVNSFDRDLPAPENGDDGGPAVAFVIDNFDSLMRTSGTRDFVQMLIHKARACRRFNVVVCVENDANRDQLLSAEWGGRAVDDNLAAMQWNSEQVKTLAEALLDAHDPGRDATACTPEVIARATAPGIIVDAIRLPARDADEMVRRAAEVAARYARAVPQGSGGGEKTCAAGASSSER